MTRRSRQAALSSSSNALASLQVGGVEALGEPVVDFREPVRIA
jgi:hypothetical protein